MIAVRPAGIEDIDSMALLWRALVEETVPHSDPNMVWWVYTTSQLFGVSDYISFIAQDGGKIIGFVDGLRGVEPSFGARLIMGRHLYVMPSYRHGEVSVPLVKSLLEAASSAGTDMVGWPTSAGLGGKPRPFRNFRPLHVVGVRGLDGALEDLEEQRERNVN